MDVETESTQDRLAQANELVAAIRAGDQKAEMRALQALNGSHGDSLFTDLNRITEQLRDVLSAAPANSELGRLARQELPDAQIRLERVLEMTEEAANTSLAAVERALPLLNNIALNIQAFKDQVCAAVTNLIGMEPVPPVLLQDIARDVDGVGECLSQVLMAQGFQDLTGQIIRRVTELVAELEQYLSRSPLCQSPGKSKADQREDLNRGAGPAIPGLSDEKVVQGQEDVDDLLGQLGL